MPTSDPRFARLATDPRFIRPSKASQKVVLDSRFKGILDGDEAGDSRNSKGKVDKYGRKVAKDQHQKNMRAFYKLDEARGKGVDRARGEGLVESSSEEEDELEVNGKDDDEEDHTGDSSSDDDANVVLGKRERKRRASSELSIDLDEDAPIASTSATLTQVESAIPTLDNATKRVAVVNLDWDNVRAIDLYKIFDSVLSASASTLSDMNGGASRRSKSKIGRGRVLGVKIYPSEFGKGRIAREEKEGPPAEIFSKTAATKGNQKKNGKRPATSEDDYEYGMKDLLQEDEGDEYDEVALRRYQLERLRYYYAVVEFDTPSAAQHAYDEIDGTEFEATANIFDLRYVPDETSFDDPATDSASATDTDLLAYKPSEFVTDALRNSKVKLTWDADDPQRAKLTRAAYGLDQKKTKGKAKETAEEVDYSALIASDSEDEGAQRAGIRAAFGFDANGDLEDIGEDEGDHDMEVTFAPALSNKVGGEDAEIEETSLDKYQRKERERRQAKKEKRQAEKRKMAGKGRRTMDDDEDSDPDEAFDANQMFENGGDNEDEQDAFFEFDNAADDQLNLEEPATASKLSKKAAKQLEKDAKAKELASLSLLMNGDEEGSGDEGRHFDMQAILRAEKISNKPKKVLKKGKDRRKHQEATSYLEKERDRFEVDLKDDRFKSMHEDHEFALDPTHPRYMKTQNMQRLLSESRRRRDVQSEGLESQSSTKTSLIQPVAELSNGITSLVDSIKRKSQRSYKESGSKRAKHVK